MATTKTNKSNGVDPARSNGSLALTSDTPLKPRENGLTKSNHKGSNRGEKEHKPSPQRAKKKKKQRKFRIGLGVRQQVSYGKLERFNSRVGMVTGILQLILALEAITLGALQVYFSSEYAEVTNLLYVWPSVFLCILSGIFGALSHNKHTYVVFLYMIVSIFACIMSCMMFGLEVFSSTDLRRRCSGRSGVSTPAPTTIGPYDNLTTNIMAYTHEHECDNYSANLAVAVILAIIAMFQVLISLVAAIYSSKVMCSSDYTEMLVEECLSDDDDGEPPPPNAGLPQRKRAQRR